ncbi:PREDICTED: uncharacterized protein LOC109329369 [Lupinus angustifolius]|uniref:uncharacterized protein LOC109329369 n=1 Tax=Lupinus angustifolius TaxID=3871 RepID=UPI00092E48E7|nr:PREDICTED: uncharacterized protein LOC109329369 [Lupinus angustifolius]
MSAILMEKKGYAPLFSFPLPTLLPLFCDISLHDVVGNSRSTSPTYLAHFVLSDDSTIDCHHEFISRKKSRPSHYSVKIQHFSLFSNITLGKYESEEFKAGDYKWSLHIYPNGNKKENGHDHVSIYLVLKDKSSPPIDAIVNFSIYNFLENEYVTTQDLSVRRFNVLRSKWGVSKFIHHESLKDPLKGFLFDDSCVFGVEVFVLNTTIQGECISIFRRSVNVSYSRKFDNFSNADVGGYKSPPFFTGKYKWNIIFYPRGIVERNIAYFSLYLCLDISTLPASSNPKVFVEYTLRANDQYHGSDVLSNSRTVVGFNQFLRLAKFKDSKRGFLVNDSCILEADVKVLGKVEHIPK